MVILIYLQVQTYYIHGDYQIFKFSSCICRTLMPIYFKKSTVQLNTGIRFAKLCTYHKIKKTYRRQNFLYTLKKEEPAAAGWERPPALKSLGAPPCPLTAAAAATQGREWRGPRGRPLWAAQWWIAGPASQTGRARVRKEPSAGTPITEFRNRERKLIIIFTSITALHYSTYIQV